MQIFTALHMPDAASIGRQFVSVQQLMLWLVLVPCSSSASMLKPHRLCYVLLCGQTRTMLLHVGWQQAAACLVMPGQTAWLLMQQKQCPKQGEHFRLQHVCVL
jgi:hypothetical protein